MKEDHIVLKIRREEALVLFEWLTHIDELGALSYEDPSEQKVLWELEGQLERMLQEPLDPNYKELVAKARRIIRESQ